MAIRTGQGIGYLTRTLAFTPTASWATLTWFRVITLPNATEAYFLRGVGDRTLASPYVGLFLDSDGLTVETYTGSVRAASAKTLLTAGVWYQLSISYDVAAHIITIYRGTKTTPLAFLVDIPFNLTTSPLTMLQEWIGGSEQHASVMDVSDDLTFQTTLTAAVASVSGGALHIFGTPISSTPLSSLADLGDRQGSFGWTAGGTLTDATSARATRGATVADVFKSMLVFDNELELGAGEADEQLGLEALNIAQHYFETLAAVYPRLLQSVVSLGAIGNVGSSGFPTSLLRLDEIVYLNASNQPIWSLDRGSDLAMLPALPWPLQLYNSVDGQGSISSYSASLSQFFWLPTPQLAAAIRLYGFIEQPEFIARTDPFGYPLRCKSAIANFAVKLMAGGVDDATGDLDRLGAQIFTPLLRGLRRFDRTGSDSRVYGDFHDT